MARREQIAKALNGTWLDRAIAWGSPELGVRRAAARLTLALGGGAYTRGREKRYRNDAKGYSADASLEDREDVIVESNDLVRTSPLARATLNAFDASVVGKGLQYFPDVNAKALGMSDDEAEEFEGRCEEEWAVFADTVEVDAERKKTLNEILSLVTRSSLEFGDAFAVLPVFPRAGSPYETRVRLIEAIRCCNPQAQTNTATLVDGIEHDESGAPLRYHFAQHHPWDLGTQKDREWVAVDAFTPTGRRNVLHVVSPIRIGQTRGEPIFAPAIAGFRGLTRFTEAELDATIVSSMFTAFIKTTGPTASLDAFDRLTAQEVTNPDTREVALGSGAVVGLGDGEDIEIANPMRPNTAFAAYFEAVGSELTAATGIPYEVALMQFKASYSAAMAELLEAWRRFDLLRSRIIRQAANPVKDRWFEEAVLIGRIPAPGFLRGDPRIQNAYRRCYWGGPARGQVREDVESKAAEVRLNTGVSTLQREVHLATGQNWESVHAQQVKERNRRERDGLARTAPAVDPAPDNTVEDDD